MKKIKDLIGFYKKIKGTKAKIQFLFVMAVTLFEFPAFIFHEFMHILAIIYLPAFNVKVTDFYFYEVEDTDNGQMIKTYRLSMQYASGPIVGIIGAVAPLIGWILAVIFFALTSHWYILAYFILGIRMFFLSEPDIQTMKSHGFNKDACSVLLKINSKIQISIFTLDNK